MILRGEKTLALSEDDDELFESREDIQRQALRCGLGKALVVEDPTDVPTSRYIEMRSGLMEKQKNYLFFILDKKAAERKPMTAIGKAPRTYARTTMRNYVHAQQTRSENIHREARSLDYSDGVDYGTGSTAETYDTAERIVDARLEAQRIALQQILQAARLTSTYVVPPEDGQSFVTRIGGKQRQVSYSLTAVRSK